MFLRGKNMTKEEAFDILIKKVYKYNKKTVIRKDTLKEIESRYKKQFSKTHNVEEFERNNSFIKNTLNKTPAGKAEIDKQLRNEKALQPGVLSECVLLQTLSEILGCNRFLDCERVSISEMPLNLIDYIKPKAKTVCAARYIYYDDDCNNVIVQYGDPTKRDASVFIKKTEIVIELKEMPALMMDTDLLYDEYGKLINTEALTKREICYPYIKKFNDSTSIFDILGDRKSVV